jgi:hypothetical protein
MKNHRSSSLRGFQVLGRLEELRKILSGPEYSSHRDIPLAHWALPTDRWLPLVFLGRSLGDLLQTPIVELMETPGIGQKKLCQLVELHSRAVNTLDSELSKLHVFQHNGYSSTGGNGESIEPRSFNPDHISEVVWNLWRADVVKHDLAHETLGRFAPSLQKLTRSIWNAPLSVYANYTLAQIRDMKTHGEKRLLAILEVFHVVHELVGHVQPDEHLSIRVAPRRIDRIERWVDEMLQSPGMPAADDILMHLIHPLLDQIRIDATPQIAQLAQYRLGVDCTITSIRQVARGMNLTRARVYQLLNEIIDIVNVRWPRGRRQCHALREKLQGETASTGNPPDLTQFMAAMELFYPGNRLLAESPLGERGDFAQQGTDLAATELAHTPEVAAFRE